MLHCFLDCTKIGSHHQNSQKAIWIKNRESPECTRQSQAWGLQLYLLLREVQLARSRSGSLGIHSCWVVKTPRWKPLDKRHHCKPSLSGQGTLIMLRLMLGLHGSLGFQCEKRSWAPSPSTTALRLVNTLRFYASTFVALPAAGMTPA